MTARSYWRQETVWICRTILRAGSCAPCSSPVSKMRTAQIHGDTGTDRRALPRTDHRRRHHDLAMGQAGLRRAQSKPVYRTLGGFRAVGGTGVSALVNLGCPDPILSTARARSTILRDRRPIGFRKWWHYHRDAPLKASKSPTRSKGDDPEGDVEPETHQVVGGSRRGAREGIRPAAFRPQSKNGVDIYSLLWLGGGDEPEFDADGDPINSPSPNKSQKRRRST